MSQENEPWKKRKRPNAAKRWKRKKRAEIALVASAPNTSAGTADPKPSVSGMQPKKAGTSGSTNGGSGTNKRHHPDEATTPNGAKKKARTGATPSSYAAATKFDLIVTIKTSNSGHLSREKAEET